MCPDAFRDPRDVLPAEVLGLYERFVARLREDDIDGARALAPSVEIVAEGWPYRNETGPLNPDAFTGDPATERLVFAEETPRGYAFGSGIAWFEVDRDDGGYLIADAGLKPID
jgi:hypothetical protein